MAEETTQNPGISRRDLIKRGAILGGAVAWATPVVQVVGMSPAFAETPSDVCIEQYADSAVAWDQGKRRDGSDIPLARSNPNNATGGPDGLFFSLGFKPGGPPGGFIELKFAQRAYSHTGSMLLVVETTTGRYPEEKAKVAVSQYGSSWTELDGFALRGSTVFSIPLQWIQYVRIQDRTDPALFDAIPDADGFDVNSVGILCQ